jgi:hypothetical protein
VLGLNGLGRDADKGGRIEMVAERETRPAVEVSGTGEMRPGRLILAPKGSTLQMRVRAAALRAARTLGVEDELRQKLELPPE